MKYLIAIVLITQASLFARSAVAQLVPLYASIYNFENSPNNFNNSPYNFNNSLNNYFDNNGNRIGYTPSKR